MTELPRSAGVLLACSSLPSPYGIGSFGEAARAWLRFLRDAGQKYWQILPLGVTGWGDSPYQSFSAFAISPYYIDLDALVAEGLLSPDECDLPWGRSPAKVDYAALYRRRKTVLRKAFERSAESEERAAFYRENADWLDDYALFMALKERHRGLSWTAWEDGARLRDGAALSRFRSRNKRLVEYYRFEQFLAFRQWRALKAEAAALGVSIIGDMPIYVALDSADVWSAPALFELDEQLAPLRVAGCPPDPFSATGQLWGNPLYRWDRHKESGFAWWIRRLSMSFSLFDVLRIDHFRGLESYYAIAAGETDARNGVWVKGPGTAFIDALRGAFGSPPVIAEDLGYLSEELRALLAYSAFPGMKVLQFAFDSRESGDYMPWNYEKNSVVYTGTHDNTTSAAWFTEARACDAERARLFFGISRPAEGHWAFIRAALSAVSSLAVIPFQDYLGLGAAARMNTPSRLGGNWQWRCPPHAATPELACRIRALAEVYGRLP